MIGDPGQVGDAGDPLNANPWTPPAQVSSQVASPAGFRRIVGPAIGRPSVTLLVLALGSCYLAASIAALWAIPVWFVAVLFSADFSDGYRLPSSNDPWEVWLSAPMFLMWGPVLLFLLAIVMIIARSVVWRARVNRVYQRFAVSGYLSTVVPLPVRALYGAGPMSWVEILMPEQLVDARALAWLSFISARLRECDWPTRIEIGHRLAQRLRRIEDAIPASEIFAEAPPAALLATAPATRGLTRIRVVLPANGKSPARAYLVDLDLGRMRWR